MNEINREEYLMNTFPLEDGTTYIQSGWIMLEMFNRIK